VSYQTVGATVSRDLFAGNIGGRPDPPWVCTHHRAARDSDVDQLLDLACKIAAVIRLAAFGRLIYAQVLLSAYSRWLPPGAAGKVLDLPAPFFPPRFPPGEEVLTGILDMNAPPPLWSMWTIAGVQLRLVKRMGLANYTCLATPAGPRQYRCPGTSTRLVARTSIRLAARLCAWFPLRDGAAYILGCVNRAITGQLVCVCGSFPPGSGNSLAHRRQHRRPLPVTASSRPRGSFDSAASSTRTACPLGDPARAFSRADQVVIGVIRVTVARSERAPALHADYASG